MCQSKTDHIRVGKEFTISGREVCQLSAKKALLQCYKGMLHGVTDSECVFPQVSPRGWMRTNVAVSYDK